MVFQQLAREMGFATLTSDPSEQVDAAIQAAASHDVGVVWVIDQGSTVTARVARELIDAHAQFSVLIATTPQSYARRVIEFGRTPMRMDLSPLSIDDSIEYVQYCLEHAGASRTLFSDNTTVRLHELTLGALADIAELAESSLALAAIHQLDEVPIAVVEAIQEQRCSAA
jgi:hypothetical protein